MTSVPSSSSSAIAMATPDPLLLDAAQTFAGELADTLSATVCHDAPIQARVHDSQVVVAALKDDGGIASLPLTIRGRHALDLRILYHCTSDSKIGRASCRERVWSAVGGGRCRRRRSDAE